MSYSVSCVAHYKRKHNSCELWSWAEIRSWQPGERAVNRPRGFQAESDPGPSVKINIVQAD